MLMTNECNSKITPGRDINYTERYLPVPSEWSCVLLLGCYQVLIKLLMYLNTAGDHL